MLTDHKIVNFKSKANLYLAIVITYRILKINVGNNDITSIFFHLLFYYVYVNTQVCRIDNMVLKIGYPRLHY